MYTASKDRYTAMDYNRCGKSGLLLPKVSLGLWHNFGDTAVFENMKQLCFTAFDNGITHFDLANNCGKVLMETWEAGNIFLRVWIRA